MDVSLVMLGIERKRKKGKQSTLYTKRKSFISSFISQPHTSLIVLVFNIMAQPARNSSDPPPYYYELNEEQKKNWMKNTRRIERNEYLKQKFPPFHTSSNISIIHIHHQTPIDIINELIMKAKEIRKYALDTESQKHKKQEKGALIQIQFIQSINQSINSNIDRNRSST